MSGTRLHLAAAPMVVAFIVSGCSFLVTSDLRQCTTNEECKRFSATAQCVTDVCVEPTMNVVDSGPGDGVDAGPPMGPPGCFAGAPTTDLEFYNACTTATYLVYDNCAKAGICDGGAPIVLVKPTPGSPAATTPLDGGPAQTCYDAVARPNVVFMNGSTNFTPFIRAMVPLLAEVGFTIVWQPTSSCTGADTIFNLDPTKRVMKNPVNSGQSYASYYTMSNLPNGTPCSLGSSPTAPAPNQEIVDLGQSDIYATSCPPTSAVPFNLYEPDQGDYINVRHYSGPVQAMAFVVPSASTQRIISAEAARSVFGLGGSARPVAPWTDPAFLWVRSATTGTTGILSRGIGVPATEWWGVDQRTAGNMVSQMKIVSTSDSERTIGTLSMDFADKEKDNLHILFFQPPGALAGYLPDLKPFTRDKENVRDGHYPLWGPIHLYARVSGGDISAGARAFVTQFAVNRPPQGLLDATIETGNVPICAMKVTRSIEMGPLRSYEAPFQCHCYYEKKLNGGTDCKACAGPAECGGDRPACNLGYCEKQ